MSTTRAKQSGLLPSIGTIGDCCDNAVIEGFWSRMQVELLDRQRWRTRLKLANAMKTPGRGETAHALKRDLILGEDCAGTLSGAEAQH